MSKYHEVPIEDIPEVWKDDRVVTADGCGTVTVVKPGEGVNVFLDQARVERFYFFGMFELLPEETNDR